MASRRGSLSTGGRLPLPTITEDGIRSPTSGSAATPADAGRVFVQRVASLQGGALANASARASEVETPDEDELDLIYDVRFRARLRPSSCCTLWGALQ